MALVIPTNVNYSEEQLSVLTSIDQTIKTQFGVNNKNDEEEQKTSEESLELQKKEDIRNEEILKLANKGFIDRAQEKYLKLKNKATVYFNKHLVKKKWLQNIGKSLQTMAQNAGSWIMQLLKFLFVMALFPGLLDTIINIFTSVAMFLIKILTKFAPIIIRRMVKIITETLPNALKKAISLIFPAIGRMFEAWGKDLAKDLPFLGMIVQKIGTLFGPDGILTNFFKGLAGLTPFFIGAGIALKVFFKFKPLFTVLNGILGKMGGLLFKLTTKLFPEFTKGLTSMRGVLGKGIKEGSKKLGKTVFSLIKKFGIFLITALTPIFIAIKAFIMGTLAPLIIPLLPIIAVVGAIIGALVLLWKYADKVYDFLDNVPKFLEEKLGVVGKILGVAFQVITAPLKFIVWLFKTIKKQGFKKTMLIIWKKIKEFGAFIWEKLKGIGRFFKDLFYSIFAPVINVFKKVAKFFIDIFQPVVDVMGPIFKKIGEILGWVWDSVVKNITGALASVKSTLTDIFNWFGGVGTHGFFTWMDMNEKERGRHLAITAAAEKSGIDMGKVEKLVEADSDGELAKIKATAAEKAMAKRLQTEGGLNNIDKNDFEELMTNVVRNIKEGGAGSAATGRVIKTLKDYIPRRGKKRRKK